MGWDRHTVTNYSHLRTNKGNLQSWKFKICKADTPLCRFCKQEEETGAGDHLVFNCSKVDRPSIELDGIRHSWTSWEDIDSGASVEKVKNKDGQWEWVDLVRKFFAKLQLRPSKQ